MIAAVDANPAAWLDLLRLQPGAEVHDEWVVTDIPFPLCNSVFFPAWAPAELDARIDAVLAAGEARRVPQLWWLGTAPDPVRARLRARGVVTDEEEMPGMALDDLSALPRPAAHGLRVERVRDAAGLADFAEAFEVGFGLTRPACESVIAAFAAYGVEGDVRHLVGYTDGGRPVASASIVVRDGVGGLYDVATLGDVRGRGYGTAITVAALREAAALGARAAILHSSPSGYGIYERLGFRTVAPTHVVQTGG